MVDMIFPFRSSFVARAGSLLLAGWSMIQIYCPSHVAPYESSMAGLENCRFVAPEAVLKL